MFDHAHVLGEQGRIGHGVAGGGPGRDQVGVVKRLLGQVRLDVLGGAASPHQPLQQGRTRQPIRPVQAGAGHFAHGVEIFERGLPPLVHPDAAAGIVRGGDDRHEVFGDVDAEGQRLLVDGGKVVQDLIAWHVRAQVEVDVVDVSRQHFAVNATRHNIARGQILPLGIMVLHERHTVGVDEPRPCPAHRLGDEETHGALAEEGRGVELHKLGVDDARLGAVGHG